MTPPPVAAGVRAPQEGAATARGTRGMSGRADLASPPTSAAHSISLQTATSPRRPGRASRLPPGRRASPQVANYKHSKEHGTEAGSSCTESEREVRGTFFRGALFGVSCASFTMVRLAARATRARPLGAEQAVAAARRGRVQCSQRGVLCSRARACGGARRSPPARPARARESTVDEAARRATDCVRVWACVCVRARACNVRVCSVPAVARPRVPTAAQADQGDQGLPPHRAPEGCLLGQDQEGPQHDQVQGLPCVLYCGCVRPAVLQAHGFAGGTRHEAGGRSGSGWGAGAGLGRGRAGADHRLRGRGRDVAAHSFPLCGSTAWSVMQTTTFAERHTSDARTEGRCFVDRLQEQTLRRILLRRILPAALPDGQPWAWRSAGGTQERHSGRVVGAKEGWEVGQPCRHGQVLSASARSRGRAQLQPYRSKRALGACFPIWLTSKE